MLYPPEFKELFRRLELIVQKLPSMEDSDDGWQQDIDVRCQRIRKLLDRGHFRVGLLSASQSGKSSTVNNIVGVDLLPEGKSGTCSSVRVRIRRSETASGHVTFRYFTGSSLKVWRDVLGSEFDFFERGTGNSVTDADLLKMIAATREKGDLNNSKTNALDYLERLLRSVQKFSNLISEDPSRPHEVKLGPFQTGKEIAKSLEDAAQHPSRGDEVKPTQHTLIEEISVDLPQDFLHPNLELIDLPGVATTNLHDILGTTKFLEELDGAFLLAKASDNLSNNPVFEQFLDTLAGIHDDFHRRIWLTLTFWDGLERHLIHGNKEDQGGRSDRTIFDTITDTVKELDFDLRRVIMISNKYHRELQDGVSREVLLHSLNVEQANGEPRTPPKLAGHPLQFAFEALYPDGGIRAVRKRIEEELFPVIQEQQTSLLRNALADLSNRIRERVLSLIRSVNLNAGSRDQRDLWLNAIHQILGVLRGRHDEGDNLADFLHNQVHQHLKHLIEAVSLSTEHLSDGTESLSENYDRISESLKEKSSQLVFDRQVGYFSATGSRVSQALKESAEKQQLPAQENSPLAEFQGKLSNLSETSLARVREPIDHLTSWSIPSPGSRAELSVEEYTVVMFRTVPQLVYEVHQRIHGVMSSCLEDLRTSISHLNAKGSGHIPTEHLQDILKELESHETSIRAARVGQASTEPKSPPPGAPALNDDDALEAEEPAPFAMDIELSPESLTSSPQMPGSGEDDTLEDSDDSGW